MSIKDIPDAEKREIEREVVVRPSIVDVINERVGQVKFWDDKNASVGFNLDNFIGIAIYYIGRATCSYHNDVDDRTKHKRTNLIKAAAVLLQAVDRIDDGTLQEGPDL